MKHTLYVKSESRACGWARPAWWERQMATASSHLRPLVTNGSEHTDAKHRGAEGDATWQLTGSEGATGGPGGGVKRKVLHSISQEHASIKLGCMFFKNWFTGPRRSMLGYLGRKSTLTLDSRRPARSLTGGFNCPRRISLAREFSRASKMHSRALGRPRPRKQAAGKCASDQHGTRGSSCCPSWK